MKHLFFTSGTTGKPKPHVVDYAHIVESAKEFVEIYGGEQGVVFNLIPSTPNIGYWIVSEYCRLTNSDMVSLGLVDPAVIAQFAAQLKPTYVVGLGHHVLTALKTGAFDESLKYVIVIKGILPYLDEIKKYVPATCKVFATYGFTECGRAWTTCDDVLQGYHVLSGGFTLSQESELLYDGAHTRDSGMIITEKCPNCGRQCQRLGVAIERLDEVRNGACA